ncbi:MAG: type II toxin-antitoxin system VapC family toxin [Chloroflexota bacterium]|nr:type II toxin-antitoxin system VapC family toxin [Chloroflexota bacterium]MDE2822482.1 type II toxin-antitoxin system VapC family toxin [Chloroflexota bacterium]
MITAVDANVLLDIFIASDRHGLQSKERLVAAYDAGAIIVSDVVYAELVPSFRDRTALDSALLELGATLSPIDSSIAYEAGLRWKRYRAAGGPRNRIIADFLIGAHALAVADVFLTRDRGFFSTYFPELYRSP